MDRQQLKQLQMPLKDAYQRDPQLAMETLHVVAEVDVASLTCRLQPPPVRDGMVIAGLHPKTGGDGSMACSADLLLQALASCAGVTLAAVATSMGLEIPAARIEVRGDLDFRGTLGVSRDVAVGITAIELIFQLEGHSDQDQNHKLIELVERYCVVLQTLRAAVPVRSRLV